jgi:hypothetical protein
VAIAVRTRTNSAVWRRIPSDVKAQLFALFDARLRPQEIEDQERNTWLYQQGQKPVIIRKPIVPQVSVSECW